MFILKRFIIVTHNASPCEGRKPFGVEYLSTLVTAYHFRRLLLVPRLTPQANAVVLRQSYAPSSSSCFVHAACATMPVPLCRTDSNEETANFHALVKILYPHPTRSPG
jgi:hypothetical protein